MNNNFIEKIDRKIKQLIVLSIDFFLINIIYYFLFKSFLVSNLVNYNLFFFVPIILFFLLGLYQTTFSVFSSYHFFSILTSIVIFFILFLLITSINQIYTYNFNELFLFSLMLFVLISGQRYALSIFLNFIKFKKKDKIMIYGAGSLGLKCTKILNSYEIISFIDDDKKKVNRNISGIKILSWLNAKDLISSKKVNYVFIAIKKITPEKKREIFNKLFEINNDCIIKFIPSFEGDSLSKFNEKNFQELKFEDFFNRSLRLNDTNLKKLFKNKKVLVTGGAGSIGLELSKQICGYSPKRLVIMDNSEFNLFNARQYLSRFLTNKVNITYKLEDINNFESLENIFKKHNFEYIFHAAALKHVKIVEENIRPAIKTNIFGSVNIIKLFHKYKCKKLVYISTDKAVRPTNFMGATKRITELYYQIYSKLNLITQKVSIVRFGNVFGSSGSVINIFKEQINNGGPLTVTNKKMERYFMSISEAVKLVLFSNTLKKIDTNIFCLDMGERIKIYDLAKKMIFLSGNRVKNNKSNHTGIKIKIVGKYKSEKLKEELFINNNYNKTKIKNIFTVKEDINNSNKFLNDINDLYKNFDNISETNIKRFFREYVEGYKNLSKS